MAAPPLMTPCSKKNTDGSTVEPTKRMNISVTWILAPAIMQRRPAIVEAKAVSSRMIQFAALDLELLAVGTAREPARVRMKEAIARTSIRITKATIKPIIQIRGVRRQKVCIGTRKFDMSLKRVVLSDFCNTLNYIISIYRGILT